jgi:4-aminobutyrate aminotransferase
MTHADKLPKIKTALPGPKAQQIVAHDRRYISPSYTRSYPLVAERASGAIVEDVDGNRFLDFSAGIATCSTGHCHPDVVRAIQQQAASLIHMSGTDFYYAHMPRLAERLEALMTDGKEWRCFFGNSGAEAIEAAMKLARHFTRRQQFIAFQQSFHGRTMGALSLTASKAIQRKGFGPLVPGVTHIPYPNPYRCPLGSSPENVGGAVLRYLEDVVFKTTVNPDEVAAIVFEAVQGEGGYVIPPPDFLPGLERLARRYGILLIADEVQCGMGRTGKMFAFQHFNVTPDIVAVAKGIASGMPLGVMMAHVDTMVWEPGAHASTFGGNPVSIAAAMETIRLLEDSYAANAATMGAFLKGRLFTALGGNPHVGDVRGMGLMIGIDVVKDKESRTPHSALRDAIIAECFKRGLLVLGAGASTIRLSPPLLIDEDQAAAAVAILAESLAVASTAAA